MKVRGPGQPPVNLLAQQLFRFDHLRGSPVKDASRDGGSDCQQSPQQPPRAKIAIGIRETKGLHYPSSPHLPQIMGSGATGAYYQWLPQCHLGLTGQMDPSISDEGDGTERTELT